MERDIGICVVGEVQRRLQRGLRVKPLLGILACRKNIGPLLYATIACRRSVKLPSASWSARWEDHTVSGGEPAVAAIKGQLDQYIFFAKTAENVADRRNGINRFFIAIHTSLLTLITFFGGSDPLAGSNPSYAASADGQTPLLSFAAFKSHAWGGVGVFLSLLGVALCLVWFIHLGQYRRLNAAKYEVIRAMEQALPFQCFTEEWSLLQSRGPFKRYRELSKMEQVLPLIALVLYTSIGATFVFVSELFPSLISALPHF